MTSPFVHRNLLAGLKTTDLHSAWMGGIWPPTVSLLGLSSLTSQRLVSFCPQRKAKDGPTSMVNWGGTCPWVPNAVQSRSWILCPPWCFPERTNANKNSLPFLWSDYSLLKLREELRIRKPWNSSLLNYVFLKHSSLICLHGNPGWKMGGNPSGEWGAIVLSRWELLVHVSTLLRSCHVNVPVPDLSDHSL